MPRLHLISHLLPGHPWPVAQRDGLPFKAVHLFPLRPFIGIKLIDLFVSAPGLA